MHFGMICIKTWGSTHPYVVYSTSEFCSFLCFWWSTQYQILETFHKAACFVSCHILSVVWWTGSSLCYGLRFRTAFLSFQWRTKGGWFGGFKPLPKFQSFDKAEPNAQFRGKYIRSCLVFLFHHPNC
jgi:hypothetical protein